MKILCISPAAIPSNTANSIQAIKVAQAFLQIGHEVTLVVPGQPKSILSSDLAKHYGLAQVPPILWLPGPRRLFPWRAVGIALRQKANLIHTWAVQSAILGALLGIPSLFEAHELPSGRFGPLWYRLFLTLPGRKRLLPITNALHHALEERYGPIRRGDVVLAPDGVDLERYAALPSPAEARHLIGLPEALTVMCTGHLYEGRGADLFLTLAEKFPQTSFVWVGGRAEDVAYWKERANGLRNVLFTGFIQHERIPLYQAAADVLLMPYRRNVSGSSGGNIAAVFSPMKLFEYMAAGRAILTSDLPVLREVLDENMAVFCPPEEVGAWETALRGLLADERRRQALGQHAQHAVKAYSWVERARRMLEGLTQQV